MREVVVLGGGGDPGRAFGRWPAAARPVGVLGGRERVVRAGGVAGLSGRRAGRVQAVPVTSRRASPRLAA